MKVLLCHPQTQHSHKLAKILYKNNFLYKFLCSFIMSRDNSLYLPSAIKNAISNRIIDLPPEYLQSNLTLEVRKILEKRILKNKTEENYFKFNEQFQNGISDRLINNSDKIIGFDSSSWIIAEKANKANKCFILERTIGHHSSSKSIYADASKKYPSWSKELEMPITDPYINLESLELKLSDQISVGGTFVKNSLIENGVPENKIFVNPYGINTDYFQANKKQIELPLTFLFFGTISARKGIPTLLNAWKKLSPSNAKLILAGYGKIPPQVQLPDNVEILGRILPDKRNELYNSAHVFIFPSLFEGFAQVLIEAAACGLPIITTKNAGGEDIVEDGINGFLVNPNDENALAERIDFFIQNPSKINEMGMSRLETVRRKFSLHAYENRWLELLNKN